MVLKNIPRQIHLTKFSKTQHIKKYWKSELLDQLKGQSHEKVGEIRAWGGSLGLNSEQLLVLKNFLIDSLIPVHFQSINFA
jgi:hypothetical protein